MPDSAADLIERIRIAAGDRGFQCRTFGRTLNHDLILLSRDGPAHGPHIYISSGIHGDEPAGPEAIPYLLDCAANHPEATWTIFPLLNPEGYSRNTRENADGMDLNRDYRRPTATESTAHRAVIDSLGVIDLTLSLHEDWEARGFYLYELNTAARIGIAESALRAVRAIGPVDLSETIDGRPSRAGVIQAPIDSFDDRDDWPEQIHLFKRHTSRAYTFETPSVFDLQTRVRMQVAACRGALDTFFRFYGEKAD